MTDYVNPNEVSGDLVQHLVNITGGGADYTFDATGNVEVMRAALESAHKGWGESIIRSSPCGAKFLLAHFSLLQVEYGREQPLEGHAVVQMFQKLWTGIWKENRD